jgi:serine---pyruvate transaminase
MAGIPDKLWMIPTLCAILPTMIRKQRIFTPGPTPVLPQAVLAMTQPMHHRSAEFRQVLERVRHGLAAFCNTKHDVAVLGCSGTGGLEAVSAAVIRPGDAVVCIHAGKFGRRWRDIARSLGARVHEVALPDGAACTPEDLTRALEAADDIQAVFVQGCETSTGGLHPVAELADVVHERDALLCVDGISWLGAHDVQPDEIGIDLLVGASQKALACPPGLAFVAVSDRAESRLRKRPGTARFTLDLTAELDAQRAGEFRFTPPVPLVLALGAALDWVDDLGLHNLVRNAAHLAAITRAAVRAMGLEVTPELPSDSLTAVGLPPGVEASVLVRYVREQTGLQLSTGTVGAEDSKKAVFRLAHLGLYDYIDAIGMLAAVEDGLIDLGCVLTAGTAATAAQIEHKRLRETYE